MTDTAHVGDVMPTGDPISGYRLSTSSIEKALLAGTRVAALEAYFGEEQYAELLALTRQAASRSVRGGPRVLLLPGIMGTKLGAPGASMFGGDDVFWLDPRDIVLGNLVKLSLTTGQSNLVPLDPLHLYYMKMKLRLRAAGFNADFWGYDWRRSVEDLGAKLVADLKKEESREVSIVAHSMGGLVTRAALKLGTDRITKLVMLGTPNNGAFVATQAIRGTLPSIRKLAILDPLHSAEDLCTQAFNTFPSTYQLLPPPERFSKFDLFDAAQWPKDGAVFDPKLLSRARKTQSLLAPADERFFLIAGVGEKTVTDLDAVAGEFAYTETNAGDGTVPLANAQLEGAPTWYVEESHGSLANNAVVARAVIDLLNTGATEQLPKEWPVDRALPIRRTVSDSELRAALPDQKRRGEVSSREFRNLLDPLLSAESRDKAPTAAAAAANTMAAPFAIARPIELNQVVVGRRRLKRLEICVAEGDITEVNARAIVLGLFSEVAPGGAALAVDQRLDGAIAECVNRRMFSGGVGELFILPTGRHPIQTDLVVFAGLGPFDRFNFEILQLVSENTIRMMIRTNVEDFATVLMGTGTGVEPVDSLRYMLEGFIKAVRDSDAAQAVRRVTFCIRDPEKCRQAEAELLRLSGTDLFNDVEVEFETKVLPATLTRASEPDRGVSVVAVEPAYLIVRQEGETKNGLAFRSSLLTAGAKATVITGQKVIKPEELSRELSVLGTTSFTPDDMPALGAELGTQMVADEIVAVLPTLRDRPLVVVHDSASAKIPWELLAIDGHFPVLEAGLSRRYLADNLSIAKWLESRRQTAKMKILLVMNPNRGESMSLDGAEEEGKRVQKLFAADSSIELTTRAGAEATRSTLIQDFRSGLYDIVHYAGHAYFDPAVPSRSGILCHGGDILSGADLSGLGNLPNLVVFNACESGRVRAIPKELRAAKKSKATKKSKPTVPPDSALTKAVEKTAGLAEAFLRGGVSNYVGTYWSVGDQPAVVFATTFYPALLRGATVGEALLAARRAIREQSGTVDWADYLHYGNQNFVLKKKV
ncbi:MAG TPA: CHAT domain-containing protein [Opitutaceae bacterium]|nr:CHAT domain-containing protein [Opitutaceae bacterium]